MTRFPNVYRCDLCGTLYSTEAAARSCEAQGLPSSARNVGVGHVVRRSDGVTGKVLDAVINTGSTIRTAVVPHAWSYVLDVGVPSGITFIAGTPTVKVSAAANWSVIS